MSANSIHPDVFRGLLDDLLNGVLSDEGLLELERRLDGNIKLQQEFRNYCQLHLNLETETRSQRVVEATDDCIRKSRSDRALACELQSPQYSARRYLGEMSWSACVGLAGCFLVAVAMAALVGHQFRSSQRNESESRGGEQTIGLDVITVRLATAESQTLPIGDFGVVSIQGPAHFELLGTTRARLKYGRVKIRINDDRGHGFVLETPRGIVTDLGTEFGVDVAENSNTGVVVFEGMVDVAIPSTKDRDVLRVERLLQGEGLSVQSAGRLDRIMSVVTGNVSTFQQQGERRVNSGSRLIVDVFDNIRSAGFKNFYEIVPGGLREDALAYADRPAHDWNGIDSRGMPSYLVGADYVKPFNNDKMRGDVKISVVLADAARLFVFFDDRVPPPDWLQEGFTNTGDKIGLDVGRYVIDGQEFFLADREMGAGKSIDNKFSIWERLVLCTDVVHLGPNLGDTELSAMYGIAAIPLVTHKP